MRGQLNLPALGVALLLLTAATGVSLAMANGAFDAAERDPIADHAATALADRLVAADGPLAARQNVLDATEIEGLDASELRSLVGERDAVVRLDGEVVARTGDVSNPRTVRRLVLVAAVETRTLTPAVERGAGVTLPRRTGSVTVTLDPPAGTLVRAVRVNGRIVLLAEAGLQGQFALDVSRFRTTRIAFDATDRLPAGSVTVEYAVERTEKGVLGVSVDA
ncbi:hypothetical protein [Salarchaeum sp. JOR-1]|uniref:DUF7263 family protein n=1 Tax=Salarchaeum sp. JOR-1 TaxID=2599399 RepID=UPI0011986F0F|nr:hypothetical protein [Salarchaeum sp. JOR-1]QDX39834.1 hypothetical protein FQU85_02565 [Salarchaeum sp. JOR-1]